jgi:DNA-directed RNA polymerase subunit RPC12/RpoP
MKHYCGDCQKTQSFVKTGKEVAINNVEYLEARCNYCGKILLFQRWQGRNDKPKQKVWK